MKRFFRKSKQPNPEQPIRNPKFMVGQEPYTFRRSRTLTGSLSPRVTASAEPRSQLKTDRLKLHELHMTRQRILHGLGALIVLTLAIMFLLSSRVASSALDYPQARNGMRQPDTAVYEQTLRKYLATRPLEQFVFTINQVELARFMAEQHAEIAEAQVNQEQLGLQPRLSIQFRVPVLSWQAPNGQFFVDERGVAFQKNYFTATTVQVVDRSGLTPDANATVASRRFIGFLGQLVAAVNAGDKGQITSVVIPQSTREVVLRLEGRDYDIRTHTENDPNHQAEDILNALGFFDGRGVKPKYVDVRVLGKAFYRD